MGFKWYVISLGTHPCCYISLPKDHKFFGMDYDDIYYDDDCNFCCHGGLTFSSNHLLDFEDGWYIGWDYTHLGDYTPFIDDNGVKYTVSMLIADVCEVICDL